MMAESRAGALATALPRAVKHLRLQAAATTIHGLLICVSVCANHRSST